MRLKVRVYTAPFVRYVCVAITTVILWRVVSDIQPVYYTVDVPLVCDDVADTDIIEAPETVRVTLRAKRRDMRLWLSEATPAVHLSRQAPRVPPITREALLLPRRITLVDYKPISYHVISKIVTS